MNQRMLLKAFVLSFLSLPLLLNAQTQETKIPIAVLPFVSSAGAQIGNPGDVTTIQEIVTSEFTSKTRFTVLDRSKFQKIIDELKIQSSEQFLNGQIVEQGKQLGAKYLVTGVVNQYKVNRSERPGFPNPAKKSINFPCSLQMSFGVINVETGQSLFTVPINVVSNDIFSVDSLTSSKKALSKMQDEVNKQIKQILAGTLEIEQLGPVDKDGLITTILTNGGGTVITKGEKAKLEVSITQKVGSLSRQLVIAELKSPKVQDQIVEWEVNKKQAKALADAFNAKTPLVLNIVAQSKSIF